jgi:hypothetical protein
MTLHLTLANDGQTHDVHSDPKLENESVDGCIVGRFERMTFPPSDRFVEMSVTITMGKP